MEKKQVCEVKKIVIKIDDKEISLTPEQAKKLEAVLSEMFRREVVKEIIKEEHHHHHDSWYWPIYQYPQTPAKPYPSYPWITYCAGSSVAYDQASQSVNCSL